VLRQAVELDHIDTSRYYEPDVVNDLIRARSTWRRSSSSSMTPIAPPLIVSGSAAPLQIDGITVSR
jgi:hypothetical protein